MLLTLVILCIVDCALVLGELTLDLYKVKGKVINQVTTIQFKKYTIQCYIGVFPK